MSGWLYQAFQGLAHVLPTFWGILRPLMSFNISILSKLLDGTLSTLASALSLLFELIVFLSVLLIFLTSRTEEARVVSMVTGLLFEHEAPRRAFEEELAAAVRSVIRFTFKMPVFHALYTWLTYSMFGLSGGVGACIWALTSMLVALTAIVPVWLLAFPGALELYLCGQPMVAVCFILLYVTASRVLDPLILTEPDPHVANARRPSPVPPYMIGLAAYGGILLTGNLTGVLIGPLLLSLLLVIFRHISQ